MKITWDYLKDCLFKGFLKKQINSIPNQKAKTTNPKPRTCSFSPKEEIFAPLA
jgi:hypothetical protein